MSPPPCQGGIASSMLAPRRTARRCRSGRTPCGRRTRRSRSRAPARRPAGAAPPARRRRAPGTPRACASARYAATGMTVPSAFETWATATSRVRGSRAAVANASSRARRVVDRRHAQARAGALAQHLPGHDVGVVLHVGDQDLVARRRRGAPEALRHQVDRLGGAAHEDDLARRSRGAEEARAPCRAPPRSAAVASLERRWTPRWTLALVLGSSARSRRAPRAASGCVAALSR